MLPYEHFMLRFVQKILGPTLEGSSESKIGDASFFGYTKNSRTNTKTEVLAEQYGPACDSIDEFLDGFPTVSREQVTAFLEEAKNRMIVAAE